MLNSTSYIKTNGFFDKVSVISFSLLLALLFSTPLFLMDRILPDSAKYYRICGYVFLLFLQLLLTLLRGWKQSKRFFMVPASFVLFWFCISLFWADHFDLSIRRLALLSIIYISTFSAVLDLGYRKTTDILRLFLALVLFINIFTVLLFPEIGIQTWHNYPLWRGLLADKNIAGVASGVTALAFMLDSKRVPAYQKIVVLPVCFIFLYKSWSRTALIAFAVSIIFGFLIPKIKPFLTNSTHGKHGIVNRYIWSAFAVLILLLIFLTIQRDILISFTNDASGLSLRNSIWRPMIQYYLDHPVLGSGYGSYWDASVKIETESAYSTQKWLKNVDQGHSGYLDLLVQTGVFGLILAIWAAVFWPITQFLSMVERQPDRAAFIFSLLMFFIVENFTESSLFADDALGNLFILFVLAQVHRFKLRSYIQVKRRRNQTLDAIE